MVQLVKNRKQCGRPGFDPWDGKIPRRRERLPTLLFCPGEFHGLYSIVHGVQRVGHNWAAFTFTFHSKLTVLWWFQVGSKGLSHTSIWTHSPPNYGGFSCRAWALGVWASVAVAHGVKLFCNMWDHPDQESNVCPLHWQADSCPLDYQESPKLVKCIPSET